MPTDHACRTLLRSVLSDKRHASVQLDNDGRVSLTTGDLAWFGLASLRLGDRPGDSLQLLHELPLPPTDGRLVLPRMELIHGRSTDVHCVGSEEGPLLLFLDATGEAHRELHFQQRGNQLALALRSWGIEVFEERGGEIRGFGTGSPWMRALVGGVGSGSAAAGALGVDPEDDGRQPFEALVAASPFLENFLVDARRLWADGGDERLVRSGEWIEVDELGREWPLEASAARVDDGRHLLMIRSVPDDHLRQLEILQAARSRDLELAGLHREVDRKEVLLHCIVHDLLAPLGSIVGGLSLARGGKLPKDKADAVLEQGLAQARRQETLIRGMLDAFSAELSALESFETDPKTAPRLGEVLRAALGDHRLAYLARGVELTLDESALPGLDDLPVVADGPRLLRVFANLLENALRHSPRGGHVEVAVAPAEHPAADCTPKGAIAITVDDQGPGVPAEDLDGLFTRFSTGRNSGAAGLGLHFCRRVLETWGGEIRYVDRDEAGARFQVKLVRAGHA
ncbi:MAG: HAMP domain-containing sensor histidine kinase [Planctomycetota bacterium]|nr:HAMP domain-containing sensor histidine kinase [Planctomycetota bacterium]